MFFQVVESADSQPVVKSNDPASKLVNTWFAKGRAAGLAGVFYDNRDRKHSDLPITRYPQLQPIIYTQDEVKRRADWGGQYKIYPNKVIIGNSSTASPATQSGSHQRIFYNHPRGLEFLYNQYRTNALYIYPEHRDHDPGINGSKGFGDLYPANSPYLISSQGSSGSDKVFMHASLKTIAAFPRATQRALIARGFLMPTVQSIFRQTYKAVLEPKDYLTGKAHPSAFEGKLIDEVAMVNLAQSLKVEAIPPLVQLKVLSETEAVSGVDFFEPKSFTTGERLSDSPCAISRVIRGKAYRRTMKVSSASSIELKNRPLMFSWVLLRGDPDKVSIALSKDGSEAEITVDYQERRPISEGSDLWSNRVDIGVFAKAKDSLMSAPAFISFTTLSNEHRTYSEDGTLLEIFYGDRRFSLGVPAAESARWDHLLAQFDSGHERFDFIFDVWQSKLLKGLAIATKGDRMKMVKANEKLKSITSAQQKVIDETNEGYAEAVAAHKKEPTEKTRSALDAAKAINEAAKKSMRVGENGAGALKSEIDSLRSKIAGEIRLRRAPSIVDIVLTGMRNDPDFFSKNEARIRALGKGSAIEAALKRLKYIGVNPSNDGSPSALYHIAQFHSDILSEALFPLFLERSSRVNYVDPQLTSRKYWRDVYDYDKEGNITGWTRYQKGEAVKFMAKDASKLSYAIDPKTKLLEVIK